MVTHLRYSLWQFDLCKSTASTECRLTNLNCRFRENDILQCTASFKCRFFYFFHSIRDRYRFNARTSLKCRLTDLCNGGGQFYLIQVAASLKCMYWQLHDSFRHSDIFQSCTALKDMSARMWIGLILCTFCPAYRVCHSGNSRTLIKSTVADRCYAVRDLHGRQSCASAECIGIYLFQSVY